MMKAVSIGAGLLLTFGAAVAGHAQTRDKVLVIYGQDKCPAGTICVTAPESERYRIPKTLRQAAPSPDNRTWGDQQKSLAGVGSSGIGSCSSSGPGGYIGCSRQDYAQAKAARQAQKDEGTVPDK